jgi:hypothetical protein
MAILKFRTFEELEALEKKGKGIKWNFTPDVGYIRTALMFSIKVPFPKGIYKFNSFEDAEKWEHEWWSKSGIAKKPH